MKVAVECKSPLLQKSLELFLSSHLSPIKRCDIVVRDFKSPNDNRTFYISKDKDADLIKPFSKSALILALEHIYIDSNITNEEDSKRIKEEYDDEKDDDTAVVNEAVDFSILEKRIDSLTQEYKQNILKAVRAFYEE